MTWKTVVVDGQPLVNYQAHTAGAVRSKRTERVLTPNSVTGQLVLSHGRGDPRKPVTRSIATILLETFLGPDPKGHQRPHFKDGNRQNYALDNLMWRSDLSPDQEAIVRGEAAKVVIIRVAMLPSEVARLRMLARQRRETVSEFCAHQLAIFSENPFFDLEPKDWKDRTGLPQTGPQPVSEPSAPTHPDPDPWADDDSAPEPPVNPFEGDDTNPFGDDEE